MTWKPAANEVLQPRPVARRIAGGGDRRKGFDGPGRWKLLALGMVLLLAGCTGPGLRKPESPDDAEQRRSHLLLTELQESNRRLETFKGVGQVRLALGKEVLSARMAWVGAEKGRLRIEIYTIAGQSLVTLVDDGNRLYLSSRNPRRYHTTRSDGQNLKTVLSVALGSDDLFHLLAGRSIVRDFHTVALASDDDGEYLLLRQRFGRRVEKIYFQSQEHQVTRMDFFGAGREADLQVRFPSMQVVDGFRVPSRLTISGGDGFRLELTVNRCWLNVPVDPKVFLPPVP